MEAAKLYIKAKDMKHAVASLQRAQNLYVQHGKISQAARACKELATALKDSDDKESVGLALESYMEAARMYETDSSYSEMVRNLATALLSTNHDRLALVSRQGADHTCCVQYKMKLEAAGMRVQLKQHAEAAKLFEAVAAEYVSNNLLKYSAKDLYMNALLCVLAEGDTTTAMAKREEFRLSDVNLEGSRQDKLVTECINAMLGSSPDDFATAVADWESMTKLEPMRVSLLLAAKETISVGGNDLLDDSDNDLDLT